MQEDTHTSAWQRDDVRVGVFLGAVVLAIWIWQWPTLDQPLVEAHWFRQTQTAYQTLTMSQGWGSFLHPKLPVFGAPWEVPFEFPLFQASAMTVSKLFNLANDTANRAAGLAWFTACIFPLWKIARLHLDRLIGGVVIIFFAVSPIALQWSRTSLIDFCAVFLGLCFVHTAHRAWMTDSTKWQAAMATFGALTGMVKATTLLIFGVMAITMTPGLLEACRTPATNLRRLANHSWAWIVTAAATMWWTNHADGIKEASQATKWISSRVMNDWNFGPLSQRRVYDNWAVILDRIDSLLVPRHSALLLLILPFVAGRQKRFATAALLSAVAGFTVFFNLFYVHDYYLVALTPQTAILLGIGVATVASSLPAERRTLAVCGAVTALTVAMLVPSTDYWHMPRIKYATPVNELTSLSTPDQQVFIGQNTWDPTTLYYARRKGLMLDARGATIEWIRALPDLDKYDFFQGPPDYRDVIGVRGWYSPVGTQTIRLDDNPADLAGYAVAFSSLPSVPAFAVAKGQLTTRTLSCDDTSLIDLSLVPPGAVVKTTATNQVFQVSGLAPVPVGTFLTTNPTIDAARSLALKCKGGGIVSFAWHSAQS